MLNECNVRLNQSRLDFVVLLSGPWVQSANVIQCGLDCFDGPRNGSRDFLVLLILQGAKVLVNNRDCICQHLCGAVSILVELYLVIAELVKQTLAKIAARNAGRIELPDDLNRFVKLFAIEADGEPRFRSIC